MTYYEWYSEWETSREYERLGQAFVNDFFKESWPELFYCASNEKAGRMIFKWLTDIQVWPNLPNRVCNKI
jgi:hypothetical protein